MIDFIKILIQDTELIDQIWRNDLLLHTKTITNPNNKTGESFKTIYYTYRKLSFAFQLHDNNIVQQMYISGSLHYYFNKGRHNANDFVFINFLDVLKDLEDKFNISPEKCILKSLEFGINITPLLYPTERILQNLFYCGQKRFTEPINKPYRQAGNLRSNDWILKVYDKRYQFPEHYEKELMRFELKYGRMRPLNKMGIVLLSDLMIKDNQIKLYQLLQKSISQIFYYDYTINPKKLTDTKQKNIINYSNINYWKNKIDKIKNKALDRKNFNYHKKRLNNIIFESSDNVLGKLLQVIANKKDMLLSLPDISVVRQKKVYPAYTHFNSQKCTPDTQLYIGCFLPTTYRSLSSISKHTTDTNIEKIKDVKECNHKEENNKKEMEEEKECSFIPDFDEFHNDKREIPF